MILDANVLLYAVDSSAPQHRTIAGWLESALNGETRVGFPVQTLAAFARISTHPRIMRNPLSADQATDFVDQWLTRAVAWVPPAGSTTWRVAHGLIRRHAVTGNLLPDALLAALALEAGVPVVSADTDFARFTEVTWLNPVATT